MMGTVAPLTPSGRPAQWQHLLPWLSRPSAESDWHTREYLDGKRAGRAWPQWDPTR